MQQPFKRTIDLLLTVPALVVLSPAFIAVAALVRVAFGSPVIFRHQRPGKNGKPFYLLKFRTMTDARDASGNLLPDEERLTRWGALLRATSLDELPQLWNVLRAEMSLVGPRPLLLEYLPRYSREQARRHDVMPGITGLAQVSGRNAISWEEKFALDTWYVDHWSIALDIRILCRTVLSVLTRRGIAQEGMISSPDFVGVSANAADERRARNSGI